MTGCYREGAGLVGKIDKGDEEKKKKNFKLHTLNMYSFSYINHISTKWFSKKKEKKRKESHSYSISSGRTLTKLWSPICATNNTIQSVYI